MERQLLKVLFLVYLELAVALPCDAGFNVWTSIGPPGGSVQALAIDPDHPETLYAATNIGIFKSTDGAASWTEANNGLSVARTESLEIDPTNPTTLYAGNDHGLFKSTDAAASWTRISEGFFEADVRALAIAPSNSEILYASTYGGTVGSGAVYKSDDAGATWTVVLDGQVSTSTLAVAPSDPDIVFVAIYEGLLKTVDGGQQWTAVDSGLPSTDIRALAIHPSDASKVWAGLMPDGIYKSTDGGITWQNDNSSSRVFSFLFDPSDPEVLYAGGLSAAFKRISGVWTSFGPGLVASIGDLVRHPLDSATFYAASWRGLFKTTDAHNWEFRNEGIIGSRIESLAMDSEIPGKLYVGTWVNGMFTSINSGQTLTRHPSFTLPFSSASTLAIDPLDSNKVWAGTWGIDVYRSIDRGVTWQSANLGEYFIKELTIDPLTTSTIYAITSDGVFKTTDTATTWSSIETGICDCSETGMVIDPRNPSTLYIATSGGIYKSTDGGALWFAANSGLSILGVNPHLLVDPDTPDFLYVIQNHSSNDENGIFKSTDGAATWSRVNELPATVLTSDPQRPSDLYAASNGQLYRSRDDGASWIPIGPDLGLSIHHLAVDPTIPEKFFAGTDSRGVFELTVDTIAPTVGWISGTPPADSAGPAVFTIEVSEGIDGLDGEEDLVITHRGTAHTSVQVIQEAADRYRVEVSGLTGTGSLALAVSLTSDVSDFGGNPLLASVISEPVFFDDRRGMLPWSASNGVTASFSGVAVVTVADLDRDGRLDLVGAAGNPADQVSWWDAATWSQHTIAPVFDGASTIAVADFDLDGFPDVVAGAVNARRIRWWRNREGWSDFPVATDIADPTTLSVAVADVDRDGRPDVISGAFSSGSVAWWRNLPGNLTTDWPRATIDAEINDIEAIAVADLDLDGDPDVVAAASNSNAIFWWENRDAGGTWIRDTVISGFNGARDVTVADLDGDGDGDVLAAAGTAQEVSWWENRLRESAGWTPHVIATGFAFPDAVNAADLDGDGDLDVIAGSKLSAEVSWWRNVQGDGLNWQAYAIDTLPVEVTAVGAADLDRDGDLDVFACGGAEISWWRNAQIHARPVYADAELLTTAAEPRDLALADLDADGDLDILTATSDGLSGWRNDDGVGGGSWSSILNASFATARAVTAVDLDRDGDLDALTAAGAGSDAVRWWSNSDDATSWTPRDLGALDDAQAVTSADIDGDGHPDVVAAGAGDGVLTWWQGTSDGASWQPRPALPVSGSFAGARDLILLDIDRGGRVDVAAVASTVGAVTWWQNLEDAGGQVWIERPVTHSGLPLAWTLEDADLNGDGASDLVAASGGADGLVWWRNEGSSFAATSRVIDLSFTAARRVTAADLDRDGTLDLIGASTSGVRWWRSSGGAAADIEWSETTLPALSGSGPDATAVTAADLDRDGDLDLLATDLDGSVLWWPNRGAQAALVTQDVAPASFDPGEKTALLAIDLIHGGIVGDADAELATLELSFESGVGVALTAGNAAALVAALEVWRDKPDGAAPGVFDLDDALLERVEDLSSLGASGQLQVLLPDDNVEASVAPGAAGTFFVVVEAGSGSDSDPATLRLTHLADPAVSQPASRVEDRLHDLPLRLEEGGAVSSGIVALTLFADSFESGDTSRWTGGS